MLGTKKLDAGKSAIACARNYIAVSGKDEMVLVNTSFYIGASYAQALPVQGVSGSRIVMESYRIQNLGALVAAVSENSMVLYEIVSPYKTVPPFDLGNVRFLV